MKIVNKDSQKEEFDEGKLWNSIYYPARESHYPEKAAVELADNVKHRVAEWARNHEHGFVTTEEIREKVIEELEYEDEDVSFMYEKHLDIN